MDTYIIDSNCKYYGLDTPLLMENAGRAVASEIEKRFGTRNKIAVFCGLGNNGGDGFVCARYLSKENQVTVYLIGEPDNIKEGAAVSKWKLLNHLNIEKIFIKDSSDIEKIRSNFEIYVDAIFGVGVKGTLRRPYSDVINRINEINGVKVSIDVASPYFMPNVVISLHTPKEGATTVVDIGIPKEFNYLTGPGYVNKLNKRATDSHKGDNGKILVIGGSKEYHGAPIYASMAASYLCDLVYVASPKKCAKVIKPYSPDFIVFPTEKSHFIPGDIELLKALSEKADSILLGVGAGREQETVETILEFLKSISCKKIIIDADGLYAIKDNLEIVKKNDVCLTPHHSEYRMIFQEPLTQDNLLINSEKYKITIVAKGEVDLISNGKNIIKNFTGNAGMTTGGTGDILAGLITAFSTKGTLLEAACAGTFLNGIAGDITAEEMGYNFRSSDMIERIPKALKFCQKF
ncbi:MAG: putative carbohydrate kinase [Candidatus Methanofastidiosum methylothiophilum]|uniref:ADP-dependent (S)-NAD(P)H-hydrate dehydratase n=1 Tax=Candidatus Methanofastidiosum methylothiophilum TaxID=1705564 RepID=A0A150IRN7_9EURY|nr:MAG: putative carbohydrate kinase [Candidatus Methanofastidiosum methylthiophilus]KYC47515.1 MAG: putative carbohydrate kinase [Candidatus Methanofastidiosum methylthiophilus]KYC50415.1 MAG: putative carbohydrate kinase [Candidatus Methanofastidiosum methylthiophilus]